MNTQIVIFCILMLDFVSCIDPGQNINAYGFNIDISRLISKITNAFSEPTSMGISVRTKSSSSSCLDAFDEYGFNYNETSTPTTPDIGTPSTPFIFITPSSTPSPTPTSSTNFAQPFSISQSYRQASYGYGVTAAVCDSAKSTQKWKIVDSQLQTWAPDSVPGITGENFCLDCTSGGENCYIELRTCNSSRINQQFYIRVHARQFDILENQVYFSFHSGANRKQCITSYYNSEKGGQTYALDRCSGTDEQSFYIQQDYSVEIQKVKSRVRVCPANPDAPI